MTNAELAGEYYTHFNASKDEIDSLLASPDTQTASKIAPLIHALNKSLTDATSYLPPYDQRRYAEQIKVWQKSLAAVQGGNDGKLKTGRGKFTFKKRPVQTGLQGDKASAPDEGSAESGPADADVTRKELMPEPSSPFAGVPGSESSTSQITIRDLSSAYITLDSLLPLDQKPTSHSDVSGDMTPTGLSITIRNVDHCIIDLRPPPRSGSGAGSGSADAGTPLLPRLTALYGDGIRDSMVIAPGEDVAGSVMLHSLERVVVITACQQFRIHSSVHAILLLSIPSNPIIEHCSQLQFGGYPVPLTTDAPPPRQAQLAVHDFSWIKPSPSPHFRVLSEEESDNVGRQVKEVVVPPCSGDEWKESLARFLGLMWTGPR